MIFSANAKRADALATASTFKKREILSKLIKRVELSPESMIIQLDISSLMTKPHRTKALSTDNQSQIHTFEIKHKIQKRGVEAKLVLADDTLSTPHFDKTLIKMIAKAHLWLGQLTNGTATSITQLAKQQQVDATEISRFLPLAFLAPRIVEDILAGSHPIDLTVDRLRRVNTLPVSWNDQREVLGFTA